ncbi:MAG TPA: hypothetical protein VIQ00_07005 [Chitinophagaceae bacterium]
MHIKNVTVILFSLGLLMIAGCKKDSTDDSTDGYTCVSCKTQPDALAANDASSKGIYKGVVIGSSGTISFNVMNDGTGITSTLVIDGTTVNLTSSITWTAGQAYVAPFTGTLNGSPVSITFTVSANGGTPSITTSSIPGHPNASFTIVKETSSSLIECFEGTYHSSLPEDGTFNLLLSRAAKVWGADVRKNGETETDDAKGIITSDNKLVEENGTVMGTLSNDEIKGSFNDSNGRKITITGKRTL